MPPWAAQVDNLQAIREQMFERSFTWDTTIRRPGRHPAADSRDLRAFRVPDGFVVQAVYRDLSLEKRAQMETLQTEKMRLLAEIGSALAHEFNTPLAVAMGNIDMLLESGADRNTARFSRVPRPGGAANRRYREQYPPLRPSRGPQRLGPGGSQCSCLGSRRTDRATPGDRSARRGPPDLVRLETWPVPGGAADPIELQEGLRELLSNAVQALPEGGTIVVRTEEARAVAAERRRRWDGMTEGCAVLPRSHFSPPGAPLLPGLEAQPVYHTHIDTAAAEIQSAEGQGTCVTISLPMVQT